MVMAAIVASSTLNILDRVTHIPSERTRANVREVRTQVFFRLIFKLYVRQFCSGIQQVHGMHAATTVIGMLHPLNR
jgi:hypothetical protein